MAQVSESLANNHTESVPAGLTAGEPHLLWSSTEISTGTQHNSCAVRCVFHSFAPDPEDPNNQPFDHHVRFILEEKQDDGTWQEIARQNQEIRKLSQGPQRTILCSPSVSVEEGVDFNIPGDNGEPFHLKSEFNESTEGNNLRVCLVLLENFPDSDNALDSVTFSVHLKRFDS